MRKDSQPFKKENMKMKKRRILKNPTENIRETKREKREAQMDGYPQPRKKKLFFLLINKRIKVVKVS